MEKPKMLWDSKHKNGDFTNKKAWKSPTKMEIEVRKTMVFSWGIVSCHV
jgi:hypothetical protein